MPVLQAFLEGMRRVNRRPSLVIALFLISFAIALPMAAAMSEALQSSIGASLVHQNLRAGFDMDWFGEFEFGRTGIGTAFSPSIIGFGAVLNNIEAFLDGSLLGGYVGVVGLGLLYILAWTFFAGGVIDTYGATNAFSRERFVASGARYCFRFLQLLVVAGIFYYLVYRYVGRPLFNGIERWTRDWTSERPILFLNVVAYAIVLFLLTFINMSFDYAKIHTVLENRKNMIAAAIRGFGFVVRHPRAALGLYYFLGMVAVGVMAVYALVAPGPGQSTVLGVVLAFLVGQIYLLARLWVKLLFLSGQTVMMASYRPVPVMQPAPLGEQIPPQFGSMSE